MPGPHGRWQTFLGDRPDPEDNRARDATLEVGCGTGHLKVCQLPSTGARSSLPKREKSLIQPYFLAACLTEDKIPML